VLRRISLAFTPEARVGDYVLLHAGFAISLLDEASARESLALLDEMEAALAAQKETGS
jgi:hydrogenase expression/formation protein HypC